MMRKLAFHLAYAKYVIDLNHGKRYVTAHVAIPLCMLRKGHTFADPPASMALRVWRCVKISSWTKSRNAAMRLDWRSSSG